MEERINAGRQKELDYAKGLAIFFMIAVHCLEIYAIEPVIDESAYGIVVEFFGSFTSATVFMILLGVGVVYSRKAEPSILVKRGILLIGAGYLLNLLRGALPMLVSWKVTGDSEWIAFLFIEPFRIDILQFAGLTFVFFGLAKKLNFKSATFLSALVFFAGLNYLLTSYGFYYPDITEYQNPGFLIAAVTGLFWGTSELSSFPFLTWIFYPIAGYLFGEYLIKQDQNGKRRLYALTTGISIAVFAGTTFLCWYFEVDFGWETDAAFYHHQILGNIVYGSCAFALIGLVYFLREYIPAFVQHILTRWSRNVTEIYFIQWILIGWIAIGTGYNLFGVWATMAVTLGILVASDGLAFLYQRMIKSKDEVRDYEKGRKTNGNDI